MIAIDHAGRLLDLNPAAERTFGCTREQVVGRDLATIIRPPGDEAGGVEGFASHLASPGGRILDRRLALTAIHADGTEFPVELTLTPLPGSDPPRFAGFVRDGRPSRRDARDLQQALRREQSAREEAEMLRNQSRRLVAQTLATEEQERRRLARMLHEGPLQGLFAAQLDLGLVARGDHDALPHAQSAIAQAAEQLREAMFMLQPQDIERLGLEHAARVFLAEVGRRYLLETSIDFSADASGAHDRLLFSLMRELVGNAAHHADATAVRVVIRRAGSDLVLEVEDDGTGLPPGRLEQALKEGHIGLAVSTERVQALRGRLEVLSGRDGGTLVRVTCPARRRTDVRLAPEPHLSGAERSGFLPGRPHLDRRLVGL
jgi:PAS domain S-box-containing protein